MYTFKKGSTLKIGAPTLNLFMSHCLVTLTTEDLFLGGGCRGRHWVSGVSNKQHCLRRVSG